MKMYKTIIGIDPDSEKSGIAFLEMSSRKLELANMSFAQIMDCMNAAKNEGSSVVFVIEAGFLNKGNWHLKGTNSRVAAMIGNKTGRNHEVARKLIEMANHYGLDVVEMKPLRKGWKGTEGKITHDELAFFTGISGRTNQDSRDSALLAWNYAGFPIRIKPVNPVVSFLKPK